MVYDYKKQFNCMSHGQYSFPFVVHIPEWVPSSHLSMDSKTPKKSRSVDDVCQLRVFYQLRAAIETDYEGNFYPVEEMETTKRITVISSHSDFIPPKLN